MRAELLDIISVQLVTGGASAGSCVCNPSSQQDYGVIEYCLSISGGCQRGTDCYKTCCNIVNTTTYIWHAESGTSIMWDKVNQCPSCGLNIV